jgi:hypothetical protein
MNKKPNAKIRAQDHTPDEPNAKHTHLSHFVNAHFGITAPVVHRKEPSGSARAYLKGMLPTLFPA